MNMFPDRAIIRKRLWRLFYCYLILFGLLIVAALWFYQALFIRGPNRFIVRNASGSELANVKLSIRDLREKVIIEFTVPSLDADASTSIPHEFNDSFVLLTFHLKGSERQFDSKYIDLWRGEGWVFEIHPDGSVMQGYDNPHLPLK